MTKAQRLSLIVALFSALSLPRSSYADSIYGTWTGVESYTIDEFLNGQIVGTYQGSNIPATFYIDYDPSTSVLELCINSTVDAKMLGGFPSDPFGPESASGTLYTYGYYTNVGNFSVTYQSILPGGMIDTSGGSIVADMTVINADPSGTGEVVVASFQTVPEPSSILQAACGILAIGIIAWIQRARYAVGRLTFTRMGSRFARIVLKVISEAHGESFLGTRQAVLEQSGQGSPSSPME